MNHSAYWVARRKYRHQRNKHESHQASLKKQLFSNGLEIPYFLYMKK